MQKPPLINSLVAEWIVFCLTLLLGILGLVLQFVTVGNYTVPAVISLVIAVLMFVLTRITNADQTRIMNKYKWLETAVDKKPNP